MKKVINKSSKNLEIGTNYFYNVYMIDSPNANINLLKYLVGVFPTFGEAEYFISTNITDTADSYLNNVEVYKYSYGVHYKVPIEKYIYKFDRITRTYFLNNIIMLKKETK